MNSLFPYLGGKHRTAPRLIKLFSKHSCYVEVFAGALNVLFAKDRVKSETVNDINGDLVNIFRIIRWHPEAFLSELAFISHSRQEFNDFHDQPGLTDIQRAVRYFFKLKTTFGGCGPSGQKSFGFSASGFARLKNTAAETVYQAHQRLDGVHIENDDFAKVIKRYDRTYTHFYCDPPYWQTAGYGVEFKWPDHQRLAETLRAIKGKFLLTINDHPDIRKLYHDLPTKKITLKYSVNKEKATDAKELIITNYPFPKSNDVAMPS